MTIPVLEAKRFGYYRNLDGGGIGFTNSSGGILSHVFFPADSYDLKTSEDMYAIVAAPGRIKKAIDSHQGYLGMDKEESEIERIDQLYRFWYLERPGNMTVNLVSRVQDYPEFFKVKRLKGREKIFKFLTTDLRMSPFQFNHYFGEQPEEMSEEHATKFHNATVLMPDDMPDRSQRVVMGTLEQVFQLLTRGGLGFVFGCTIRFYQLKRGLAGDYVPARDEMRVAPTVRSSERIIYVLLHEFMHRWWYQHSTMPDREHIREMFKYQRQQGEQFMDPQATDLYFAAMDAYNPGDRLEYIGRKREIKNYGPVYVIRDIDLNGNASIYAEKDDTKFIRMRIPVTRLIQMTNKWRKVDGNPTFKKKAEHEIESDQWFPTKYSMTDEEEWWSEISALWLMGKLKGKPARFVQEVLS